MPKEIRPIRVVGDVAYVTLTQGHVAIIDAVDVPLVDGVNWRVHKSQSGKAYAKRIADRICIYMHRLILNCADHMQTDHVDCDGLNNRRENLREATGTQNQRNKMAYKNNKSGFKGVSFHILYKKWQASISFSGRDKYLGYFSTPEEAHAAYCEASAKYHGEFGRTE
jgi:hypothetical protein